MEVLFKFLIEGKVPHTRWRRIQVLEHIVLEEYGENATLTIMDNQGPYPDTELVGVTLTTNSPKKVISFLSSHKGFRVWTAFNLATHQEIYKARELKQHDAAFATLRREGKIRKGSKKSKAVQKK